MVHIALPEWGKFRILLVVPRNEIKNDKKITGTQPLVNLSLDSTC
jgi:hypothetical protein